MTREKSLKSWASFSTKGRLSPATEAREWNNIREFNSSCKDKVVDSQGYVLDPDDDCAPRP